MVKGNVDGVKTVGLSLSIRTITRYFNPTGLAPCRLRKTPLLKAKQLQIRKTLT